MRPESFGGIVGLTDPPALVFVDQDYMRTLGLPDSPLWHRTSTHLSAPTEVHFNLTRRCQLACRHCTSNSSNLNNSELSTLEVRDAIDTLAKMGVFHIAFGGGELFLRSDAIELAQYARTRNIIPNATTNGYAITPQLARECVVFGQVNVSLDALGPKAGLVRGNSDFARIDQALKALVAAGVSTGINCVVTRANFEFMDDIARYAEDIGLKEVLFLRLKPSGRAKEIYHQFSLLPEQARALYPKLAHISELAKITIQTDCSFVPHLCAHNPSIEAMKMLGVEGCGGGDMLLGINAEGAVNACSHHSEEVSHVRHLDRLWNEHSHFHKFRSRRVTTPRCLACSYVELCKGGCPLFSEFILGDFDAADPECPLLCGEG